MTGTPRISTFYNLGGKPAEWEVKQIWESATEFYFVAINRTINRTVFITDDGTTSTTKVIYSTKES